MYIFIFILIINSIFSINKVIELDFNTYIPNNTNIENFIENYYYNKKYTEIFIGTPPQKINLSIKLQH
jgi:ribosomal protein S3